MVDCLYNMGAFKTRTRDHGGAEPFLREALEKGRALYGSEHPFVAQIENELGRMLNGVDPASAEAEALFRHSGAALTRALGADAFDVSHSRMNLAVVLAAQGRHAEAEEEFRRVIKIRALHVAEDDTLMVGAKASLGRALYDQGKNAEAEPIIVECLPAIVRRFGAAAPRARRYADLLARLYESTGRPEKAAEVRAGIPPEETPKAEERKP